MRASDYLRRNLLGCIAIFIALGGTAVALPGRNQVDSGDIKKAQVKRSDLAPNSVDGTKVADNSLTGADVDESTLGIDFPEPPSVPTSLPPSGPAGGDLSGEYPSPGVREAALDAGGDLAGPLSAAAIAANAIGTPESAGGEDEIADGSVDTQDVRTGAIENADIENTDRELFVSAAEIGDSAVGGTGEPDFSEISGLPAVAFDGTTNETVTLTSVVPPDIVPNDAVVSVRFFWAAFGPGTVRWTTDLSAISVGDAIAFPAMGSSAGARTVVADQLAADGGGGTLPVTGGDLVRLRLTRDAASATDNVAADAALLGVVFSFRTER